MKNLLTVTAVLEVGTGLALVTLLSLLSRVLLGSSLGTPEALTVERVAGVALVALGVSCWLARHDGQSPAAKGLVSAMVVHNAANAAVLVYAGTALGLSAIGLWPVVLVHAAMAIWYIAGLTTGRRESSSR
jgi:hypothetical protein